MTEETTARRVLNAVLPGSSAVLRGRPRGLLPLGLWIALLGLAFVRRGRIAATVTDGGPGEWVALAGLLLGLSAAWVWGRRRTAAGVREAESGRPLGRPPADADGRAVGSGGATASSQWRSAWRGFRRHRQAAVGLFLMGALCLAALLAPYLAPYDPNAQGDIVATRYLAPSWAHPLGTDRFGRDVLSRVLFGARISLSIGFLAVGIAVTLGTVVGAVAGYVRGWLDTASMRLVDLMLSFPRLVLLIAIVGFFPRSILLVVLVLGLTGWMGTSRIVRGEVLSVREREFIQAARALGFGDLRILARHILPNVMGPVIVAATLGIGNTILVEASLSFLGLGVQPPTASWGNMIASGKDVMLDAWWITTFPGLAIVFTVMAFNLVGDGLRDALDPRRIDPR